MKRYNIDTESGDLVQFDLKSSWTLNEDENDKVALFICNFEQEIPKHLYVPLSRKDLEEIKSVIEKILD